MFRQISAEWQRLAAARALQAMFRAGRLPAPARYGHHFDPPMVIDREGRLHADVAMDPDTSAVPARADRRAAAAIPAALLSPVF